MEIFDISMAIHPGMQVYKNKDEKKPHLRVQHDHSNSGAYETVFEANMHTGTHVDAPLHMIENGDTIDKLDLSKVVTKCKILDMTTVVDRITARDLESKGILKDDFILLKSVNSFSDTFDPNFIFLDKTGAEYLRDTGIKGVGTDALGIERSQPDHGTHKILFEAGITIIEGLRLVEVPEGEYMLFAAPLKVIGAEAAPTRAVLVKWWQ